MGARLDRRHLGRHHDQRVGLGQVTDQVRAVTADGRDVGAPGVDLELRANVLLAVRSGALRQPIVEELLKLGTDAASGPIAHIFWSAIIGGWIIALVAWVVTASHWTIGQVIMVWFLTFIVGVAKLSHCIASSGEILSAVVAGILPLSSYIRWIIPATLGNIVGGVFIVSMLNYGQVRAD